MNAMTKQNQYDMSPSELALLGEGHVAYIRAISNEDAIDLLEGEIDFPKDQKLFCLYMADGTPIAITDSREGAVESAEEHDLMPMSVH